MTARAPRRLTCDKVEAIMLLRRRGLTWPQVSEKLDLAVWICKRDYHLAKAGDSVPAMNQKRQWTRCEIEYMTQRRSQGSCILEIARDLDRPESSVSEKLDSVGTKAREPRVEVAPEEPTVLNAWPEQWGEMTKRRFAMFRDRGYRAADIGRMLRLDEHLVKGCMHLETAHHG